MSDADPADAPPPSGLASTGTAAGARRRLRAAAALTAIAAIAGGGALAATMLAGGGGPSGGETGRVTSPAPAVIPRPPPPTDAERAAARPHVLRALAELARPEGAEAAVAAADAAIVAAPRLADAHVQRARALERTGRLDESLAAWDRAMELEPERVLLHLDTDLDRGRAPVRDAIARWLERAARCDDPVTAAAAAAVVRVRGGDAVAAKAAADELEVLVGRAPDRPIVRLCRARVRWDTGKWELALADADVLVTRWPEQGRYRLTQARMLLALRRWPEAEEALAQAEALRPDMPEVFFERGRLGMRAYRVLEAREALERASALAPNLAGPIVGLAGCACHAMNSVASQLRGEQERDIAEAARLLDRAAELEPLDPDVDVVRGWVRYFHRDYDAALEHAARVLAADPRVVEAHQLTVYALSSAGRREEADAAFERWRRLTPDPAEAHLTRAMARVFNNREPGELELDPAAATRDFLVAQQLAPRDPSAFLRHAAMLVPFALRRQRDAGEQIQILLQRARELDASYVDRFWTSFGTTTGFIETLARAAAQVPAASPRTALEWFAEGQRLAASGDYIGAEKALLQGLAVGPPLARADIELARLYLSPQAPEALGRSEKEVARAALDHSRRAVKLCESPDRRQGLGAALVFLAWSQAKNDLFDEANESLRRAREAMEKVPIGEPTLDAGLEAMVRQAEEEIRAARIRKEQRAGGGD